VPARVVAPPSWGRRGRVVASEGGRTGEERPPRGAPSAAPPAAASPPSQSPYRLYRPYRPYRPPIHETFTSAQYLYPEQGLRQLGEPMELREYWAQGMTFK